MRPSVGRIVLYVVDAARVRPAVVTAVWDGECCNLRVLLDGPNDAEVLVDARWPGWVGTVSHDEGRAPGTWHWPLRVGP